MPPPPPTWRRLAAPRDPPEVAEQALPRAPISTSTLNSTSVPGVAQGTCSPTVTTGSSSEQTTTMPLPATFNFEAYQRFMEFEALRAQMLSATPSTSIPNMALEIQQSPIPEAPVGATLHASQPPVAPREEASVTLEPLMPPVLLQRPRVVTLPVAQAPTGVARQPPTLSIPTLSGPTQHHAAVTTGVAPTPTSSSDSLLEGEEDVRA
jgi:hypothetical protein